NWSAGALFRPTSWLELGAVYVSNIAYRGKGTGQSLLHPKAAMPTGPGGITTYIEPVPDEDAKCAKGGTVANLKTCIDFDLPQRASVGGRIIKRDAAGREKADLEVDVRWENWSADAVKNVHVVVDGQGHLTGLDLQPVTIHHGFVDTWALRVGGSWRIDLD